MEIQGKLIVKEDTVNITDSFKKREFVVEENKEVNGTVYQNPIKCQLTQDNCSKLDDVNIGDEVKVSINIRGNKFEKDGEIRYFNNINAWKVEVLNKASESAKESEEETDNLPF